MQNLQTVIKRKYGKFGKEPHFYLLFPGFPNLVSKLETAVIHAHDARISTVVTTLS